MPTIVPGNHSDKNFDPFNLWYSEALKAWERVAPSYVRADIVPARGDLRQIFELSVSPSRFEEAIEIAFARVDVTKRRALFYAYGILRNHFGEES